jgi:predicted nucleic acid-binding protein
MIDTNIMLDYVLNREPFANSALACLERLFAEKAKVYLTASTITDIYYLTNKTLHDREKSKDVIAKLLNAFQIVPVDKTDCVTALGLPMTDYEDALVSVCSKKVKAEYIITRNLSDYKNSPVPAIEPIEFLKIS